MEMQYSVEFFTSFVEHLQDVCRNYLNYSQFVEVSGYVCVEIDNMKKERYVLSELLQSSGNVVSESFCTKAVQTQEGSHQSQGCQNVDPSQASYSTGNKENRNYKTRHPSHKESHQHLPYLESPTTARDLEDGYDYGSSSGNVYSRRESYNSGSFFRHQADDSGEVQITLPECTSKNFNQKDLTDPLASSDGAEVIDLDMFEDDPEPSSSVEEDTVFTAETNSFSLSSGTEQRKNNLSPGTLSVVKNSVKQFRRFHFDQSGIDVDLHSTPPEKLNMLLLDYFRDARKADGQVLTARTLKNVQIHIDMYLRDGGYAYSLNKDRQFQSSRDYLKKKLNEGGKVIAQKHSPVDEGDVEILFQTNQLGAHSPETLTNTMWFLNSKYFAIRRPAEHLNMKWGDISVKVNDDGQEYIERPINGTFSLKVFAKPNVPNRCFVNFYKQYRAMRPKIFQDDNCPFYLKYDRNPGYDCVLLPEPLSYSAFTCIWRKLVVGGKLPVNKKIF